jgi:hypothetical protein
MARTFLPWSAKARIKKEAKVVFPTPPLPLMAIFIRSTLYH